MARAALIALLAACAGEDRAASDVFIMDLHVASPTAFDTLHVWRSLYYASNTVVPGDIAPITPAMLANGEPAPTTFVMHADAYKEHLALEPARTSEDFHYWELGLTYKQVVVIAFEGAVMIGGDAQVPAYDYRGEVRAVVELSMQFPAEMWGAGAPDCARIVRDVPHYTVRAEDRDCDGIRDPFDCQPAVYCVPDDSTTCGC